MEKDTFINMHNIPLYDAVRRYTGSQPTVFHMPGHKLGKGIPAGYLKEIASLDVTEIPGTDNLHYPEGAVKDAQELAARAFGADKTFFLVNGSTCGIQAMIMAVCNPGGKLIVGRDCHKSVINGMILAGVKPVYLKPGFDRNFGISTVIAPPDLRKAVEENPDATGVLITRPNYYGVCSDIKEIVEIVHKHNKALMVDEAHGAHLKFSGRLPVCAMEAGADICVQSAHKTLPAFTQGSYLHVKSKSIDIEKLGYFLRMLQTSSPSYIIMSFLDIARHIMEKDGGALIDRLLDNIAWLEDAIGGNSGNSGRGNDDDGNGIGNGDESSADNGTGRRLQMLSLNNYDGSAQDRTRVVINVKNVGITGFQAAKMLRDRFNIQVDMSDLYNIVCITSIADRKRDFKKLYSSLAQIAHGYRARATVNDMPGRLPAITATDTDIPVQGCEPWDVINHSGRQVRLENSSGEICRDIIVPYPPGIAVLCPGEVITQQIIDYISGIIEAGGTVNGIGRDFEINVIG